MAPACPRFGNGNGSVAAQAPLRHLIDFHSQNMTVAERGAAHDDLVPGLRHLTIDRAIYWYLVDEDRYQLRILAIFFGPQDHQRRMLVRLLGG